MEDEDFFSLEPLSQVTEEPSEMDGEVDMGNEDEEDKVEDEESVHAPGIPRSDIKLDARYAPFSLPLPYPLPNKGRCRSYHSPPFAAELLHLLRDALQIPCWNELSLDINPQHLSIHKVSGALTNAVFFVSLPQSETDGVFAPTVLVRIYGPSSGSLISVG